MRSLGFTLTSRVTYARVALVLDVIALAWLPYGSSARGTSSWKRTARVVSQHYVWFVRYFRQA